MRALGAGIAAAAIALAPASAMADHLSDSFAGAHTFTAPTVTLGGSTAAATNEPGEPRHHGEESGSASVWFRWTAPDANISPYAVEIDTEGTAFDAVVAVYTGTTVGGLTKVASQDAGATGAAEHLAFRAHRGATYAIVLDGVQPSALGEARIRLSKEPPANDDFAAARELTLASDPPSTIVGLNTQTASHEYDEPYHAQASESRTVWYRLTAPLSGRLAVDTCATEFNSVLGVYTGSSLPDLVEVASNDNGLPCLDTGGSQVAFAAVAGTSYSIAVAPSFNGFDTNGGFALLQARYDLTPPDTSITKAPPAVTSSRTAKFEFQGSGGDIAGFECAGDDEPFKACTSPTDYPPTNYFLPDGSYRFRVRAVDHAGNLDPTPAEARWRVGKTVTPPVKQETKPALPVLPNSLAASWKRRGRGTSAKRLALRSVRPGWTVFLVCRGASCPFRRKSIPVRRAGTLDLRSHLGRRALRRGTRLEIRWTAPGAIGRGVVFRIRAPGRRPLITRACLAAGTHATTRCPS